MERNKLKNAKRIVVKVGTSTLTYDNGKVNYKRIEDRPEFYRIFTTRGKK